MTRREILLSSASGMLAQNAVGAAGRAPVVNGAEHAWTVHDPRFPIQPRLAVCPNNLPDYDYSAEYLLSEMHTWRVDHVVISHVCYYGRDNSYPSYCVKKYPGKFAAIGLLVGHRLYSPSDPENAGRLERLIREDGLVGLRLSPIYNREVVWLNDPVCYPLWKKAGELGAVFNIFLAPHQVGQVGDMARRFPGVNVVIDHMAMIDITAPDEDGFGPLLDLAKYPNVYVRTSLHNPSKTKQPPFRDVWPFLRRLYDRFGPRRLVWANFFELLIMKELIPFFSAEDKEWILGRTAHRLYRFPAS
ncbi:MAG TPA: amidohydrolase family protein [Bryobacteraceae bacterium]|nr:amidohydrolase family protein [Bryobacteraceae bacterium]